jgi:hypothetical protein
MMTGLWVLNKKKISFSSKMDLNVTKKISKVLALCGAETWTFQKADQKYKDVLKYWAGEEWRKSVGLIV